MKSIDKLANDLWNRNGNHEVDAEELFKDLQKADPRIVLADVIRAFEDMVENHIAERTRSFAYVPYRSTAEKLADAVRDGFRNSGYFDHEPTDNEIIAVLRERFCRMASCHMKLDLLTRDGAIARQLVERLHFEFYAMNHQRPVRISYLLKADSGADIQSTLVDRKRMLADLAGKGFLRIENNKVVPITPYPAWSVYARSNQ